ncbi:hypothetical protein [Thalassospira sp. A3_1]|uniref:hypothetical protein n=1 Tax=Thalassospira sp. A3_1 TaxID=2821088 RepID=UPI001ADBE39C|nr:hypothetical protein [Thalassospira sp. A3_1]MBO9508480.1 hypothetical protein [Thalassospira sp. A3_1]
MVLPRPELFSGAFIPAVRTRVLGPVFYEVIFHNQSDFSFLVNNGSGSGVAKIVTMRFGHEKPAFICVRNTGFGRHETKNGFLFV